MENLNLFDNSNTYTIKNSSMSFFQEKVESESRYFYNKNNSFNCGFFGIHMPSIMDKITRRILDRYAKVSNNINNINNYIRNYRNEINNIDTKYKNDLVIINIFLNKKLFKTMTNKRSDDSEEIEVVKEGSASNSVWLPIVESVTGFSSSFGDTFYNVFEDASENDKWGEYWAVAGVSAAVGSFQPFEQMADCTVQATSELYVYASQAAIGLFKWMGADDDMLRKAYTTLGVEDVKSGVADFVGRSYKQEITNAILEGMNCDDLEYKDQLSQTIWTTEDSIGTIMLGKLPGPWSAIARAVSAEGKAAELAYQQGASYDQAALVSHVDGAVAFGTTFSAKYLKQVFGSGTWRYGAAKAGTTLFNETAKAGGRYAAYEKDKVDENGNPIYDNFFDYYVRSGAASNSAVKALFAYASSYTPAQVTTYAFNFGGQATSLSGVIAYNYANEVYNLIVDDIKNNSNDIDYNNLVAYSSYNDFFETAKNHGIDDTQYGKISAFYDANEGKMYVMTKYIF